MPELPGSLPQVYLVRHGETAWTISGQRTGRTDLPLTPKGEREAFGLVPILGDSDIAVVLTSPSLRASRTAELAGYGDQAVADADLLEWDYGAYEGRRTAEIRAERPGWRLFEDGCPGGEGAVEVGVRADRLIARVRQAGGDVLIFGHRDMFRVLIARWIGLPPVEGRRFTMDTASVSVMGYDHGLDEPVVKRLNLTEVKGVADVRIRP